MIIIEHHLNIMELRYISYWKHALDDSKKLEYYKTSKKIKEYTLDKT